MNKFFLFLVTVITFCCCNSTDDVQFVYAEYSLPQSCVLPIEEEQPLIVSSETAYAQLFAGVNGLKAVDFDNYNLLLVKGTSTSGIERIEKTVAVEGTCCSLSLDIKKNLAAVMQPWHVALLLPKEVKAVDFSLEYVDFSFE